MKITPALTRSHNRDFLVQIPHGVNRDGVTFSGMLWDGYYQLGLSREAAKALVQELTEALECER